MRFVDYMRLSSQDDDIATFRSLKIQLVKNIDVYDDIVKRLTEKYQYINESIVIIHDINKHLRTMYKGKLKYGFCIDNGINVNELNIHKGYRMLLSIKYLEMNDNFVVIKRHFENDMRNN